MSLKYQDYPFIVPPETPAGLPSPAFSPLFFPLPALRVRTGENLLPFGALSLNTRGGFRPGNSKTDQSGPRFLNFLKRDWSIFEISCLKTAEWGCYQGC